MIVEVYLEVVGLSESSPVGMKLINNIIYTLKLIPIVASHAAAGFWYDQ